AISPSLITCTDGSRKRSYNGCSAVFAQTSASTAAPISRMPPAASSRRKSASPLSARCESGALVIPPVYWRGQDSGTSLHVIDLRFDASAPLGDRARLVRGEHQ